MYGDTGHWDFNIYLQPKPLLPLWLENYNLHTENKFWLTSMSIWGAGHQSDHVHYNQTLSSRLMDRKQKTDKMIWWFMPKDIHIKEPPSRAAADLCCQHQNGEQLHHRSFLLPPLAPHSSLLISTYLVDSRYYLPRTLVDIHWARVDV